MIAILSALLPTFGLIVLGFVLRKSKFLPEAFWPGAEKLTYFVTFPALLLANTAKADLQSLPLGGIALAIIGTVIVCSVLMVAIKPVLSINGPSFSSVFQGVIRPNTYIGLGVGGALFSERGMTVTALCVALVVPTVNILSVAACSIWGHSTKKTTFFSVLCEVIKNPLLIACFAGLFVNAINIGWPPVLGPFIEILARISLPIGLLAVGAGLDIKAAKGAGLPSFISTCGKLVISPVIALGFCLLLNIPATDSNAIILYAALPCSASAYVLARLMGGDAEIMASIITIQTLVALVTLPVLAVIINAI